MKKAGPYIGVSGFMSNAEVKEALAMVPQETNRRLMVGALMSAKTLAGKQNNWPGRYPKREVIGDIFIDDPRALNLIHFSADSSDQLFAQLMEMTELGGPHLDGFQLNIKWPLIQEVEAYAEVHPEKFLVLQVGERALFGMVRDWQLTKFAFPYLSTINCFLFDCSGGKGAPLNPVLSYGCLRAIDKYQAVEIGVAGGLGPDTLHLLDSLVGDFPNLSIDAEGGLRTPKPEDALDLSKVKTYLKRAYSMLGVKIYPRRSYSAI